MFIEIRTKQEGDLGENDIINNYSFEDYVQMLFNFYIHQNKIKYPKIQKINFNLSTIRENEVKKPLFSVCDVYIHVNENEYLNLSYYDKFNWVVGEIIAAFTQISNNLGIENSDSIIKLNEEVKQKINSFEYTIHKLKYTPSKKYKCRVYCIITNEIASVFVEFGLKTFKSIKLLDVFNNTYDVYCVTNNFIKEENDTLVFIEKHNTIKVVFDLNTEEIKYEINEEKVNENLIWFNSAKIKINNILLQR